MYYITLDTNTWIYLANGTEPVKLLNFIKQEVEKENITILLPEIVIKEWEVNKDKAVRQGSIKHFNDIENALERILKLLGDKGEKDVLSFLIEKKDDGDYFKDFIENFKKKKSEIEGAVSNNIKVIDDLFRNKSTVIEIKNDIYIKCGKYALEKKAPFKFKNSYADALILFSLLDYVKTESIKNSIFISYNTDDFCEKKDKKRLLHPDLVEEFKEANCHFYTIVGEALNTVKKDILSKEELDLIQELQNDSNWNNDIEFCLACQENNDKMSEVYFGGPIEIIDERLKNKVDLRSVKNDFFLDSEPVFDIPYTKTIEVGNCDWCDTEHFKCIVCGELNAIWQNEYNEDKECEGCGLTYFIKRKYDRKGIEDIEYTIPNNTIKCEKCGEDFNKEDMIENLCINCENEYSYE